MNAPASNSARRLNGGQALAEMLKLSGVGPMFGMGGFQLLPFRTCRPSFRTGPRDFRAVLMAVRSP